MICPPCKQAGYMNQEANYPDLYGDAVTLIQVEARRLHALCDAPSTCACAHFIGQELNEQAMVYLRLNPSVLPQDDNPHWIDNLDDAAPGS